MSVIDTIGSYKLKMNNMAGRIVFGNTVRFSDNLRGKVSQIQHRITTDADFEPPSTADLEELRDVGYLDLAEPFSADVVERAQDAFQRAIEDEQMSAVRGSGEYDGKVYSRYIRNVEENAPELYDLLTDDILDLVGAYLGSTFELEDKFETSNVAAWRNTHHPDHATDVPLVEKIGSGNWHCDRSPPDRIKLFVILSEVDENCGPLHLLSKAETKRIIGEYDFSDSKREEMGVPNGPVDEHANEIYRLVGAPGRAALANTVPCMHRAGLPSEGRHRDIVQFEFRVSSDHLTDQIPHASG